MYGSKFLCDIGLILNSNAVEKKKIVKPITLDFPWLRRILLDYDRFKLIVRKIILESKERSSRL